MKPGSIVECVKPFSPCLVSETYGLMKPELGRHYTIREIRSNSSYTRAGHMVRCAGVFVLLEEIKNAPLPGLNVEVGFGVYHFREIEFPPAFEKEFQKLLTPPLKVRIMSKYKEKIEALRAWLADRKPQKKKQPAPAEVWNPKVKPFNLNK